MEKHAEAHLSAIAMLRTRPREARFGEPLEFLLDEHMRQRALCTLLEEAAFAGRIDEETGGVAVDFLNSDFGLHVLDEEEDLFPLLRRRVPGDDHLCDVLGELSCDHVCDKVIAIKITEGLRLFAGQRLETPFCDLLRSFAVSERRHMIVENAIVIPLARASLSGDDLATLGRRMAARRGIVFKESSDAV